jgi:hypothetical protein
MDCKDSPFCSYGKTFFEMFLKHCQ